MHHPENHRICHQTLVLYMSPCCGVVTTDVRTITQSPPHWDRYRQAGESCGTGHISDTNTADGGRGFKFPFLQRLPEQMCFDINRNTACISKMEDCFVQQAYHEHLLNAQIMTLRILGELIHHVKR